MKMERLIGILSILLQRKKVTAPEIQAILAGLRSRDRQTGARRILYTMAFTIKMSKHKLEGYFDYVVPHRTRSG